MVTSTLVDLTSRELTVVDNVLRDHGSFLSLGRTKDHGIGLAAKVETLGDRCHIVALTAKLQRSVRRPHLVEKELHARSRSCWRCQAASARAASSSTRRIQSSISAG